MNLLPVPDPKVSKALVVYFDPVDFTVPEISTSWLDASDDNMIPGPVAVMLPDNVVLPQALIKMPVELSPVVVMSPDIIFTRWIPVITTPVELAPAVVILPPIFWMTDKLTRLTGSK